MVNIHRTVFPCVFLVMAVTFLVLGAVFLSFSMGRVEGSLACRTENEEDCIDIRRIPARYKYSKLSVDERCTAQVTWNETEPEKFMEQYSTYKDQWDCIEDYEKLLLSRYAILGTIYSVLTPLTCCLGALHHFFDPTEFAPVDSGLRPQSAAAAAHAEGKHHGGGGGGGKAADADHGRDQHGRDEKHRSAKRSQHKSARHYAPPAAQDAHYNEYHHY